MSILSIIKRNTFQQDTPKFVNKNMYFTEQELKREQDVFLNISKHTNNFVIVTSNFCRKA